MTKNTVKSFYINQQESNFLSGPRARLKDLRFAIKVMFSFVKGFRKLHFIGPCVTVFGSARFKEDHPYYEMARSISASLALEGFTIMTGGGPGIMEAGNRGAKDVGGRSVGCNIILPHEQSHNPYMDRFVEMEEFFTRKVMLLKYSYAFVVMPGGFGTLDEFFETLTLIQTGKIKNFPIVVMGLDYWQGFRDFLPKMVEAGTISPEDLDLVMFTDSISQATKHIKTHVEDRFKLVKNQPKALPFLGESK